MIGTWEIQSPIALTNRANPDAFYVGVKVNPPAGQRSWEQAADEALGRIFRGHEYTTTIEEISYNIGRMKSDVNSDDWSETTLVAHMNRVGKTAFRLWAREGTNHDSKLLVATLSDKQAGYGTENIMAFGLSGIHVRMSDKAARLQNLQSRDVDETNFTHVQESVADTLMDLAGYAVVANMLYHGTFTLPLERDLPFDDEQLGSLFLELGNQIRDHFSS